MGDVPAGALYSEFLLDKKVAAEKRLRVATDIVEIHRAQGELTLLEELLNLRSELLKFEKDILAGKVKPASQNVQKVNA